MSRRRNVWNEQPTPFVWNGNAGSGGADPGATKPIGSGALGMHAPAASSKPCNRSIRMPDPTADDPLAGLLATVAWNMAERHEFAAILTRSRGEAAVLLAT